MSDKVSKVFVMGATGAGKSTLLQFVAGVDFEAEKDGLVDILKPINPAQMESQFAVSNGTTSQTSKIASLQLSSTRYNLKGPTFFIDTPGFGDTDGKQKDVDHFLELRKELNQATDAKFLILVDRTAITGKRGEEIQALAAQIGSLFGGKPLDDRSVLGACTVVFTHVPKHENLLDTRVAILRFIEKKVEGMKNSSNFNEFQLMILEAMTDETIEVVMMDETRVDRKRFVENILRKPGLEKGFEYAMDEDLRLYILKLATEKFNLMTDNLNGQMKDFKRAAELLEEITVFHDISKDEATGKFLEKATELMSAVEASYKKEIISILEKIGTPRYDFENLSGAVRDMGSLVAFRNETNETLTEIVRIHCDAMTATKVNDYVKMFDDLKNLSASVDGLEKNSLDQCLGHIEGKLAQIIQNLQIRCTSILDEMKNHDGVATVEALVEWFQNINGHSSERISLIACDLLRTHFPAAEEDLRANETHQVELLEIYQERVSMGLTTVEGVAQRISLLNKIQRGAHESMATFVEELKTKLISSALEATLDEFRKYNQGQQDATSTTVVVAVLIREARETGLESVVTYVEDIQNKIKAAERVKVQRLEEEVRRVERDRSQLRRQKDQEIAQTNRRHEQEMTEEKNKFNQLKNDIESKEIRVKDCKGSKRLEVFALHVAREAVEKCSDSYKKCLFIQEKFASEYGSKWSCIIGNAAYSVYNTDNCYICLHYGKNEWIVIFKGTH